jgi:prepilin-type N-terminal cleavage/methylation domain-containing protein
MKRKRQKGFTLIELTIAIFIGTIVIVATGMILFWGHSVLGTESLD